MLPDCSRIEPDQMQTSMLQCRSTLKVLRLGTCGRCVGDEAVEALEKAGGVPRLETAVLAGESGVLHGMSSLFFPAQEAFIKDKRAVRTLTTFDPRAEVDMQ